MGIVVSSAMEDNLYFSENFTIIKLSNVDLLLLGISVWVSLEFPYYNDMSIILCSEVSLGVGTYMCKQLSNIFSHSSMEILCMSSLYIRKLDVLCNIL